MYQAPPLSRFTQFPATAGIGLIAIAVTVLGMTGKTVDVLHMNVLAFEGEPWRIWTSAFPHGGIIHLAFNIYWLWIFGTAIEQTWGSVRTLVIFALFEAGASLAEYALFHSGIGLSGIGYGLFGLLWILSRRDVRFTGVVNSSTIRLFIAWYFLCIAVTAAGVMSIGNIAHTVGAIMGVLLGFALTTRGIARIASVVALPALVAGSLGAATIWRPQVNVSTYGGADSAKLGYEAYNAGKPADAIPHLRRAIEINPDDSGSWYNLGLSLGQTNKPQGALEAFRRASAIAPKDPEYRSAVARTTAALGIARAQANDYLGAITLYKESLAVEDEKSTWFNLSLAYTHLEDWPAAVTHAREAWKRERKVDYARRLAFTLIDAGDDAYNRGDPTTALAKYIESMSIAYTDDGYDRLVESLPGRGELRQELELEQIEGTEDE